MARNRCSLPAALPEEIQVYPIESIDLEAQGIARVDGKVSFVRGALPGETVRARVVRKKASYEVAETLEVLKESSQRVKPLCPSFGVCGGCSMQHLTIEAQIAIKQRALEDQLWHLGRTKAETVMRPIAGPTWGYRYRARLSVRYVAKKGGALVGFREKNSSFVVDMRTCAILEPSVAALLPPLRELVGGLSFPDRLPQIEVAVGGVIALVFRVLQVPTAPDEQLFEDFARKHQLEVWLQAKGPEAITFFANANGRAMLTGEHSSLGYSLPEFDVFMPYRPTDFTQVNHAINTVLVSKAMGLLAPEANERIADLFCGLGNFSLALARKCHEVLGIEGLESLTQRAQQAARLNGLEARAKFATSNLFEMDLAAWQKLGHFDRLLIDPPREGALALANVLAEDPYKPKRLVYVSCNPATLARDVGILCGESGGWVLKATGAVNMFPHTSHVESISVLEPQST